MMKTTKLNKRLTGAVAIAAAFIMSAAPITVFAQVPEP